MRKFFSMTDIFQASYNNQEIIKDEMNEISETTSFFVTNIVGTATIKDKNDNTIGEFTDVHFNPALRLDGGIDISGSGFTVVMFRMV